MSRTERGDATRTTRGTPRLPVLYSGGRGLSAQRVASDDQGGKPPGGQEQFEAAARLTALRTKRRRARWGGRRAGARDVAAPRGPCAAPAWCGPQPSALSPQPSAPSLRRRALPVRARQPPTGRQRWGAATSAPRSPGPRTAAVCPFTCRRGPTPSGRRRALPADFSHLACESESCAISGCRTSGFCGHGPQAGTSKARLTTRPANPWPCLATMLDTRWDG
ncbi:hypothetical protein SAMN04488504_103528 [Myxococcus virescens]|uniref:Uncharacterized protein n=1 Tax=Myxococcus virescens TaxID=83456 RepID=A0ABY0MTH4_9BACT|nr:hypothetical protein SAMN04488504_103528 [Myxococcus virescens]